MQKTKTDIHLEFKPLVQVDPSVLSSNRAPLQNPRPGDYLLKQTASTEGIASKKSLELKKRYLLGESGLSSGIMKSDSTSVLDSKFKNFHSTISGCQKMLNPSPEISPAMKHFLNNTKMGETKSSNAVPAVENQKEIEQEQNKNVEEKENVYKNLVNTRNELNKTDVETAKAAKITDYSEAISTVLVENNNKELSTKPIETIDLTTPEKAAASLASKAYEPPKVIANSQVFVKGPDSPRDKNCVVIDLTGDSPVKEVPVTVKPEKTETEAPIKHSEPKVQISPESTKKAIDSMLQKQSNDQSRSPVQDTQITVPKIPWTPKKSGNDAESDSVTSSSSSSVDDIPHYILDSTTSPDTLPGDRFVPRLEVRDTSGELMQIDSLMIIDGKYVGDPDDLKHMKLPESSDAKPQKAVKADVVKKNEVAAQSKPEARPQRTPPEKRERTYRYESINRRPDLKFDTKNENKIDSLKNLPLIIPKGVEKFVKPTELPLNDPAKTSDTSDNDKTPTAANPIPCKIPESVVSDSETEMTGQVLTETELSDWTADDAVSENFVDIEFALNSNKGTIKRNKKSKKRSTLSSHQQRANGPSHEAPIAKDLDFDNIEFMDTGSEESCAETYSATNKALLKNRGYVEFVSPNAQPSREARAYKMIPGAPNSPKSNSIEVIDSKKNIPKPGIDYIEQGACVLAKDIDLKTPINEVPPIFGVSRPFEQHDSLNEIEDDSLVMVGSQGGNTTTEESDALTVVTSPMESMPRNIVESSSVNSSFDHPANYSPLKSSSSKKSSSQDIPTPTNESPIKKKSSRDDLESIGTRKESDDISYEDYVRQLQQKITQISNARDSIDVRKTKRKYSKGESSFDVVQPQATAVIENNKPLCIYVNKSVPAEPATETERIEEITKERTKQKDLIHDLVMNKLQTKKQLNAEKRLNRSRNRGSILSSNMSPSAPNAHDPAACAMGMGHRVSQSSDTSGSLKLLESERTNNMLNSTKSLFKTDDHRFASPAKLHAIAAKERPRSDNIDAYSTFDTPKLNKTQSFCLYANRNVPSQYQQQPQYSMSPLQSRFSDNISNFSTPINSTRRPHDDSIASTQTEKLRAEARARARLKSNQDLGLSPEEKIAQLRKRYNLDMNNASGSQASTAAPSVSGSSTGPDVATTMNKSDDMKVRERKMMASKSVNDIALVNTSGSSQQGAHKLTDSSSDPNLLDGKAPSKRRPKDPERRKSIIQAVSDFFHKKKEKEPASPKEKSEGMFGRFRISPKSKSKVWRICCLHPFRSRYS